MSTNGCFGFRITGQDKLTYNHSDSYPEDLGVVMFEAAKTIRDNFEKFADQAAKINLIDADTPPTQEQIQTLSPFTNLSVSGQNTQDWYCLTRELQGNPLAILEVGIMVDSHKFMQDGGFCEYAYIINFDEKTLEVYRGFQEEPHEKGRYAHLTEEIDDDDFYYPVALVASFPWDALERSEDWLEQCEVAIEGEDESDEEG